MDNIFTALVRRRTTGVVMEFVLWCIVCFAALLSLIALAMGAGNFVWILLLLTAAGLGVIMAFRLKEVALLYSVCVFNAILFLIHYLVFSVSYGGRTADGIQYCFVYLNVSAVSGSGCLCICPVFFEGEYGHGADNPRNLQCGSDHDHADFDVCGTVCR